MTIEEPASAWKMCRDDEMLKRIKRKKGQMNDLSFMTHDLRFAKWVVLS